MNTKARAAYHGVKLLYADFGAILPLRRAARYQPALVDGEYQCVQEFLVANIERNVEKDVLAVPGHSPSVTKVPEFD